MPIAKVEQKNGYVYVWDQYNALLCSIPYGGGQHPKDGMVGYTSSAVRIRSGHQITEYDERGRKLSSTTARD